MTDESYIQLTIEIAKKGKGKVSPNPLVGAILVKDEKIIGAGFHEKYGESHAEINAIRNARQCVENSTLYVNLEPCSHYGKTPPCVDAIIENKIKRVVIGTLDMNPLVCGTGIKKLKEAGIEVKAGVLENECIRLNKFFFKYITKDLPYITIKAAQTLDGKIADKSGESKWISSIQSRKYVHTLRSEYDAVLVGSATVVKDDPQLTVRLIEGRDPKRIILDTQLRLSLDRQIFRNNADKKLIIITSEKSLGKKRKIKSIQDAGIKLLFVRENKDGTVSLKQSMQLLARESISSVLVEGGKKIFSSFIRENLFDEILLFISPKFLGDGIPVISHIGIPGIKRALKLKISSLEMSGDDILAELIKN